MTLKIGKKIVEELHEGVCSSHIGGCTLPVTAIPAITGLLCERML